MSHCFTRSPGRALLGAVLCAVAFTAQAANACLEPAASTQHRAYSTATLTAADGVCLRVFAWKPATPQVRAVVVITHGIRDYALRYGSLVKQLTAQGMAVYAQDLRGHAHSGGDRQRFDSMTQMVADVDLVVSKAVQENPGEPLFVFGHSLGGLITTEYALAHGTKVKGVILSGAALKLPLSVSNFSVSAAQLIAKIAPGLPIQTIDDSGFARDKEVMAQLAFASALWRGRRAGRSPAFAHHLLRPGWLRRLAYVYNAYFTTEASERLADALVEMTPPGLDWVFFGSGGSESMDGTLKMALQFQLDHGQPARRRFISRRQSYHGCAMGGLAVSGNVIRRMLFEDVLMPADFVSPCYAYRDQQPGETAGAYVARLAQELEDTVQRVGPDTVAAFIAEPVVGATNGAVPALLGYFKAIKAVLDRRGILFIADEILTGAGRTGTFLSIEQDGVTPDIVTLAKGLGAGYQPISAIVVSGRAFDAIADQRGYFIHGHTYNGSATPLRGGAGRHHRHPRTRPAGARPGDEVHLRRDNDGVERRAARGHGPRPDLLPDGRHGRWHERRPHPAGAAFHHRRRAGRAAARSTALRRATVTAIGPSSRRVVDPELTPLLYQWMGTALSPATLSSFRALLRPGVVPEAVLACTELQCNAVPGPHGAPGVEVVVRRPKDGHPANDATGTLPAVLHLQGGGFIAGGARDEEAAHRALAAGLALRLRDSGGPDPAWLHLTYPMLDDRSCTRAKPNPPIGKFIWTASNNAYAWRAWLVVPPGSAGVSDEAAPGRSMDLHGLPPTFIATGALALFMDEDLTFANRLLQAGIRTELRVCSGAFHGFDLHPAARLACASTSFAVL